MRIPRIYTTQSLREQGHITLEPAPSQHLSRALRKVAGDRLLLFNGEGGEYSAVILEVGKKAVRVEVQEHHNTALESPLQIHLGISASRGERMDWVIQKTTELGVASVSPLFTERCEVKLSGERAEKKQRHWQQIAISACEQCGRNEVPQVQALTNLESWLQTTEADCKLVLHHRAQRGAVTARPRSVALLIGPEGGLSDEEIAAAEGAGFLSLRLGPRVLRTETAPLAAIAILQAQWGDMSP